MVIPPEISVLLVIWGGICAADQRALGGRQIHQPIVAAVGTGILLGAPERAFWIGLWMQLVWSAPLPLGGVILPDTGSAVVAASVIAVVFPGGLGFLIALLLGLLIARLSIPWERRVRSRNQLREQQALSRGSRALARAIGVGIFETFARGAIFVAVVVVAIRFVPLSGWGPDSIDLFPEPLLREAMIGGAAAVGGTALLHRFRKESGRTGLAWVIGGLLLGAVARFLVGEVAW